MKFSLKNNEINSLITEEYDKTGIILIWGDTGVGKTTLCLTATLSMLSTGKKVLYINTKSFFKQERFDQMKKFYPDFNIYNFLVFSPKTLNQQTKIIMDLEFFILEEIHLLGETKIGLIVLDSATTLEQFALNYEVMSKKITEDSGPGVKKAIQKSREYNQKLQIILTSSLATLEHVVLKYSIPVIITTRSTTRFDEVTKETIETPINPKILEYFSKISLKIERTSHTALRKLILRKHPNSKLKAVNGFLSENGFN